MSDLSSKTFCVCDHGYFIGLANRLAESGARVLFHNPSWAKGFPVLNEAVIGDGLPHVECVPDLFEVINEVDCFVWPDIYHDGLQKYLRSIGKNVWGSAGGMILETNRVFFLKKLAELGLDVPPYTEVRGVTRLRMFLKDKKDIWIKMSKFRGSFETKHFRNMDVDGGLLDVWAVRFGGLKEHVSFLCFPKIETELEIGADTYCIDGQWPSKMLHGIEAKDSAYFAAVTGREEMPEQLLPIMEAFSPFLKEAQYRQQWSMEVRVGEEGDFFIDATCRGGLPSTGSQLMAIDNLPEIIFHGSQGDLVEPEYNCKFTAECMVSINGEAGAWATIELPDELKRHLKLCDYCEVDGRPWFPADTDPIYEIGWLVATGDTPVECAERVNELADLLPDGADADVESLAEIFRQIESEKESGIKFSEQPAPDPEIVLQES